MKKILLISLIVSVAIAVSYFVYKEVKKEESNEEGEDVDNMNLGLTDARIDEDTLDRIIAQSQGEEPTGEMINIQAGLIS